ncbi:MAG: Gfo/Idh/MocA family oxidoreductase [Anaerolineae bacterium]|nr:Gfo/Idh/MocA family oxidoreductase [Anaerolineae bacterium]
MKLCMIGSRGHNNYVWAGLARLPQVQVAGITSGTSEDDVAPLKVWCEQNGHTPATFDDYCEMLDQVNPDIVSICGPFEQRAEMCSAAFQRGIHVFCEKTVAITMESLTVLKEAYAKARTHYPHLHFAAMMGLRYDPAFYTAWRAVQDGAMGTVRIINTRKSYKLGTRADYYRQRATYGGTISWVGSHAIDWIYWFSAATFQSVYATQSTLYNRDNGELEISALCHFTLTDEIFASASIDMLRPETAPTHGDDRVRVIGTKGTIEVQRGRVFLINSAQHGEIELTPASDRQIFCDFVNHIEGKTETLLSAADTFAVTEACLLAQQSADIGQPLHFGTL